MNVEISKEKAYHLKNPLVFKKDKKISKEADKTRLAKRNWTLASLNIKNLKPVWLLEVKQYVSHSFVKIIFS